MDVRNRMRRIVKPAAAPALSWFDARFAQLDAKLAGLEARSGAEAARAHEVADVVGRILANQRSLLESMDVRQQWTLDQVEALSDRIGWLAEDVGRITPGPGTGPLPDDDLDLEMLDPPGAAYLNRATGWRGFASVAGVFVNDAINLHYSEAAVDVLNVNERIAEIPFVFAEMAKVPPPARVLDVGASESPVALSLATLGYQVTAADPRGYAFAHPGITVAAMDARSLEVEEPFDAIILLSTIEHVGIAHYGNDADPEADLALVQRLRGLSHPGTRLILTTPFGPAAEDGVQRIYDPDRLRRLLDGWEAEVTTVLTRVSDTEWRVGGDSLALPEEEAFSVVLVSATLAG